MATHSGILAQRILWTEDLVGCCLWGCTESDTTEATQQQQQQQEATQENTFETEIFSYSPNAVNQCVYRTDFRLTPYIYKRQGSLGISADPMFTMS